MQNTTPSTIIVGDTSALISLAVGNILSDCLGIVEMVIPETFVVGKFHELVKTQPKSCWSKHNNPIQ